MARLKSVLLVDFDNIFAATGMALVDTLPQWLLWLSDGALSDKGRRRKFVSKRVYWNSQYDVHREAFQAAGFETFDCRAHAKTKIASGKSSADIVMTMDAIELRHSMRGIDEMVILTTDSDFVPVVNRLQLAGLRVVTAGKETDPTYELYSEHADDVIHIGALKAAFDYERTPRKWYKLRSAPPVIAPLRQQAERRSPLMMKVRKAVQAEKANGTPGAVQQMRLAADIVMQLGARTPDQPLPRNKGDPRAGGHGRLPDQVWQPGEAVAGPEEFQDADVQAVEGKPGHRGHGACRQDGAHRLPRARAAWPARTHGRRAVAAGPAAEKA